MNTKMKMLAILAGLGLAAAAIAHEDMHERQRPSFEDIDTDKDMLISREEIETFKNAMMGDRLDREGRPHTSRFDMADTDGDGYVNETEFNALLDLARERRERHRRGLRPRDDSDDGE